MKDFIVIFILLFITNFLPMVYGWNLIPTNPYWIIAGYSVIAFLYAVGSAVSKQRESDKQKLVGEGSES